jgi:hypothetical protein
VDEAVKVVESLVAKILNSHDAYAMP